MSIHPAAKDLRPDEQVFYDYVTGWPSVVQSSLNRKVGALCRHGAFHRKIGITNDPSRRWRSAYRGYGWLWMNVVYESSSHDHVCQLEYDFIERFRAQIMRSDGWYYNAVGGGGGRKPHNGPYYLYLVTAPKFSRIG